MLSRLNIFGLWRDGLDTDIEPEQETATKAQEAQRQEREEAQKRIGSDTTIGPDPVAGGVGGRTVDGQSQHDGHGSEGANPWIDTDVLVRDYSARSGGGYDGGAYGGGGDCGGGGGGGGGGWG